MLSKAKNSFIKHKDLWISIFCGVLMFACIFPTFVYLHTIPRQVVTTALLTLSAAYVIYILKIKLENVGRGLKYFVILCIIAAVVAQVRVHILYAGYGYPFRLWYYIFYYDKPFDVWMMWMIFAGIPTLVRIFRTGEKDTLEWREKYKKFFSEALKAFFILYIAILVYGLFLVRGVSDSSPDVNLIPLRMIWGYINSSPRYTFENFFMFWGNALLLAPLGFCLGAKFGSLRKYQLWLWPFIISGAIELSQYIFRNGHVDIDDVILNVISFYIGYLLKVILDLLRRKVSHGEEKTVFNF